MTLDILVYLHLLTLHKQSDCKATNEAKNRQTDDDFVHMMKTTGVILPVQSVPYFSATSLRQLHRLCTDMRSHVIS